MKLIPKYKEPWGKLTLNDFITSKIDSTRNAAYNKSLERTEPKIPTTQPVLSEEEFIKKVKADRNKNKEKNLEDSLKSPFLNTNVVTLSYNDVKKRNKDLYDKEHKKESEKHYHNLYMNYRKENCDGTTCTATGFDNYGLDIYSGKDFKENVNKEGFKEIPYINKKAGDIVLINKSDGTPHHTMIYSNTINGIDLFNHSNGGFDEYAIRKNARYPIKNGDYPTSYTFVGTPQDSIKWINEYNQQYK